MDIQTYVQFGIFFGVVFAWYACAQIYITRMMIRLPSVVAVLDVMLVPTLLEQKQTIAHNLLKQTVVPVWQRWMGDLRPMMTSNNLFTGIALLATALWMSGHTSIWICVALSIPLLASMFAVYILRKRQKLIQNGFELVYISTTSLASEESSGIPLTPEQLENKTASLNTLNDEVYWKQMARLNQPEQETS